MQKPPPPPNHEMLAVLHDINRQLEEQRAILRSVVKAIVEIGTKVNGVIQ